MPDSPTLLDLFAEDIGHASQLLQLVDEEFQALERRELPVLQQLLGAKQPLMQQLERNGRARAEILREAGVPSTAKALPATPASARMAPSCWRAATNWANCWSVASRPTCATGGSSAPTRLPPAAC